MLLRELDHWGQVPKIIAKAITALATIVTITGSSVGRAEESSPVMMKEASPQKPVYPLVIDIDLRKPVRTFRPDETLGAAFDGAEADQIDRQLTPHNISAMKSAGLRPLSYRLRTELGINAWHWNPVGSWSDPEHQQGYWTSSDQLGEPINLSWGYRLPRRGDTIDNANDDDYSRLTDGDQSSFWKSNPYLDPAVLHDGEQHPQWLIVRFGKPSPVDRAVIDWAEPFATRYEVQYWNGHDEADGAGHWVTFPHGSVTGGRGGRAALALTDRPISARFIRILLHEGSGTGPAGASDWRDRMGYAVREVSFGTSNADGSLADVVIHAPSHQGQTFTHVSSTDPWHRTSDLNRNLEQAGIDRIFASTLGFGLPVMIPTGLLFDTPENAEAELRYIARRNYPVRQIELGEEADGQYGSPIDYAALYLTTANRLQNIIPGARFGGPSLQSAFTDVLMQPEMPGSWNQWFVAYLKRQNRLDALGFVTFEYYPFDDICGDIHAKLIEQSNMLDAAMRRFDQDGVPYSVPRIISEYGFSAYSGRAMAEMPSALLMAGIAGQWLQLGGSAAYMFGYPPNEPINQHQPCAGYGNMMLFSGDPAGQAQTPMPSYYTARLLTAYWMLPGHRLHRLLNTAIKGVPVQQVIAYTLGRPDGKLAVLLVNRSTDSTFRLALMGKSPDGQQRPLHGPGRVYSYGPAQYLWRDDGPKSQPVRSAPPAQSGLSGHHAIVTLPPDTIQVVILGAPQTRPKVRKRL